MDAHNYHKPQGLFITPQMNCIGKMIIVFVLIEKTIKICSLDTKRLPVSMEFFVRTVLLERRSLFLLAFHHFKEL